MILLISGASHTGKTALAQRLLEKYHMPYLSIDHLKMGLIRSGQTRLIAKEDEALTAYLWPIVREMIKTAIENGQHLIVEGCHIPYDWQKEFSEEYLQHIRAVWLVMTENYICRHFDDIRTYASVIEDRGDDEGCTLEQVLEDNKNVAEQCRKHGIQPVLIDEEYQVNVTLD
ncbi:MAG: adenylate kinase [Clostridia bacterium]|nr:adenylate kinase [Clostridia bacterium]